MDKKWMMAGIILFVCITAFFYFSGQALEKDSAFEDGVFLEADDTGTENAEETAPSSHDIEQEEPIKVYICGEVKNPGVYELLPDQRLSELLTLCGGFTKKAAPDSLNLARKLLDGEMVYVMSKEEMKENKEASSNSLQKEEGSSLVNINQAKEEELMSLPGIGQSKADSIIKYRETKGSFETIADIMKIEGIKAGVFEKIKDLITV